LIWKRHSTLWNGIFSSKFWNCSVLTQFGYIGFDNVYPRFLSLFWWMVPHLENSLHLVVEGKTILYHLSFLSWDWKYSLGSSLEKKIGERNRGIKISRLDRGSLTSIKSCPNTYCIWWGKRSILQNLVSSLAKIATPQFKHPLFLPLTSTTGLPNVDI